ncbi:MAG: 4Fe-4S binding protein [Alistipes sp.]|nr:4Fe-4S binding protein [Alistipes sp.]
MRVSCSSKDKGVDVKKACSTGCIGCSLCQRNCPVDAVKVEDSLAHIDYDVCAGCGLCERKCPAKCITSKETR